MGEGQGNAKSKVERLKSKVKAPGDEQWAKGVQAGFKPAPSFSTPSTCFLFGAFEF
jgi:hypothetical protein